MAAIATNGIDSSQMRGRLSVGTKALKSFSEELASAANASPSASPEGSAPERARCPKVTRRSSTDVTNMGRESVRRGSKEDRREGVSKQEQASAPLTTDKAPVLEPTSVPLQVACERVLPYSLTTETVGHGARSFTTKLDAVARGNGDSSIGTARLTPPAATPEASQAQQLRTTPSAPDQVASKSEGRRSSGADAASPSAISQSAEESVAHADMPAAKDRVETISRAEPLTTADTSIEEEGIRIVASFDAKNIPSIPVVTSRESSEATALTGSMGPRESDQNTESLAGVRSDEKVVVRQDKAVSVRSQSPVAAALNMDLGQKLTDQLHSQLVDQLRAAVSNQQDSKREQEIQQIPNADREVVDGTNILIPSSIREVSRSDSSKINLNASSENDAPPERTDRPSTVRSISDRLDEGPKGAAFKSQQNVRRQQVSSIASETSVGMKDSQSHSADSSREKAADASESSTAASSVPASITQVSTTPDQPETGTSTTRLDATAELERTRQLVAAHSFLQTARLTDRGGRTELNVGLTAGELGNISIRTFMVHDQVKAEISVQKEELRNLLAVGLPEIQNKISRMADTAPNVVFSAGADQGQNSNGSAQTYQHEHGSFRRSELNAVRGEIVDRPIAPIEASSASVKLDIRM